MFSYWSKDGEENSENSESDEEQDKSPKPECFLYVGNEKRDEHVGNQNHNLLTGTDVFQNNYNANVFRDRKKQMNDMLDNVWSVRKDVRVNTNAVKASDIGGKSFYSRHGGVSGAAGQSDIQHEKNASTGGVPTKTWSTPRITFSYSDNLGTNQYDILDDNNGSGTTSQNILSNEVQRQNIVNSFKHGMTSGPRQEMSARTKRAEKFHNAYLRSTGLGKYTPHIKKPSDDQNITDKKR